MQAIQLSIWGAMPQASAPAQALELEVCPREENESTMNLDPCKGCPLSGICAADDCGAHLFDLDCNEEPCLSFEEWLSEPWD